jgi:hypothetical protein
MSRLDSNRTRSSSWTSVQASASAPGGSSSRPTAPCSASQYQYFTFTNHKSDFTVKLSVYPNLTDQGRVRVEFDAKTRYELFKDFYVGLSLYESYDSRPPTESAAKNDWGMVMSIGYSY